MIKRIEHPMTGEAVFVWTRLGRAEVRMRRICGGVGWPGRGLAGFLVVVGEEVEPDRDWPDQRRLHVLGEWADWQGQGFLDPSAMFQAMGAVQRLVMMNEWCAEDKPQFQRELRAFNRGQADMRRAPLRLTRPKDEITPEWMAMRVHLRTSGRKTMFFHQAEQTRAALSAMPRDFSELTWNTAPPAVAALLLAMSVMETRDYAGPARGQGAVNAGWAT